MLSGAPVTRNALIGFGAAAFVGCQFAFKFQVKINVKFHLGKKNDMI